jgi:hypothetical protein
MATTTAIKTEYRALKHKLRDICSTRRIRLEEFMKTFDMHKTKKITTEQFARAIDSSGIRLTSREVDLLLQKYRFPNDARLVDYRRFCDLIDKPCTKKDPEKHLGTGLKSKISSPSKPIATTESMDSEALRTIKEKLLVAMQIKVSNLPLPRLHPLTIKVLMSISKFLTRVLY